MITTLTPSTALRAWQGEALDAFVQWRDNRMKGDSRTFVAAVTGGAGKTRFGVEVANILQRSGECLDVVVLCPSVSILNSWLHAFSLHEMTAWSPGENWPAELRDYKARGFVLTYAMLMRNPSSIAKLIDRDVLVISDEIHHLRRDDQAWGDAANIALRDAGYRLFLTGTPIREDEAEIPFVKYARNADGVREMVATYTYDYAQGLRDKIVRPIKFHAIDANATWMLESQISSRLIQATDAESQKALEMATNPKSAWLSKVIWMAHQQLLAVRRKEPNAGGMITVFKQEDAKAVQRVIQQVTHTNPTVVISDDPDASDKLDAFAQSDDEWLVSVKMVSEGVDIPRLRVGVFATRITTRLFFLQWCWRFVRLLPDQQTGSAHLYIPAHQDLLDHALTIRDMRLASAIDNTHPVSPASERAKPEAGTTFISSTPGEVQTIVIDAPEDQLDLLVRIQEVAASAIADYARKQSDMTSLTDALTSIREALGIHVDLKPARNEAKSFEIQRQWRHFEQIAMTIQALPQWQRDLLSFLYDRDECVLVEEILQAVDGTSESKLTTKRSRDLKLLGMGLIEYDDYARVYRQTAQVYLENIFPDLDAAELIGYLVRGETSKRL